MIYSGFLLFCALVNLSLGLFVLSRESKQVVNRTFCYWLISMTIWHIMDFGLSISPNDEFALKWIKVMLTGVFFIPSTFYHFVVSFLKEKGKMRYYFIPIGYIISFLFIPLSLSGFLVDGVISFKTGGYFPQFADTPFPQMLLFFFYSWTLAGTFLLIRRFIRTKSAIEKNQLKYVIIGLTIAILGGIFNFALALGEKRIFPVGNLAEMHLSE